MESAGGGQGGMGMRRAEGVVDAETAFIATLARAKAMPPPHGQTPRATITRNGTSILAASAPGTQPPELSRPLVGLARADVSLTPLHTASTMRGPLS